MELYWNDDKTEYAVLVSRGYGAGWSSWSEKELAYDKRVVEFWLAHKDDKDFMDTVNMYSDKGSMAYCEASHFFKDVIGLDACPYMGGFRNIEIEWIPRGVPWRMDEYDGAEYIHRFDKGEWTCFN